MAVNEVLARKGMGEPLVGLLDQVGVAVGLGVTHGPALAKVGWRAADTALLRDYQARLQARSGDRTLAGSASKAATLTEAAARANGKDFKRTLTLGFDDLQANAAVSGETLPVGPDALDVGREVGRSTPVLIEYLGRVRPTVRLIGDKLRPYFDGKDPVVLLDKALADLSGAQAKQEVSLLQLPQQTQDLYELKGRALALVERLNRLGKIAFGGQAAIAAQFNKDLLLRARRSGTGNGEAAPADPPA